MNADKAPPACTAPIRNPQTSEAGVGSLRRSDVQCADSGRTDPARRAARLWKRSCGPRQPGSRVWAKAGAGPFAEFATWQRSEPSMSKRSGSCADVRQAFAHPRWLG
jgi:hypothetical protein